MVTWHLCPCTVAGIHVSLFIWCTVAGIHVEVTYTSDLHLHDRVQTKIDQHADLRRNLLAYGWVNVQI